MLNQVLRVSCYAASIVIVVCLAILVQIVAGCQVFRPSKVVDITAKQCILIAKMKCRYDIAEACTVAKDLAPLLDLLAKEPAPGFGACEP